MKQRRSTNYCHTILSDWGRYTSRLKRSGLGFPGSTVEARAGEGKGTGKGSSITPPAAMIPPTVVQADRAIRQMPQPLKKHTENYYSDGKRIGSHSYEARMLREIHCWLDGYITGQMGR